MNEELSYSWKGKDGNRITVIVEPSPTHPNACRFLVEPAVFPEGAVHFADPDKAKGSPLAETLFAMGDVTAVTIAGKTVNVTTQEPVDWAEFSSKIASLIRDQINSGIPSVSDEIRTNLPTAESIRERVQEVIDTAVNPAVAAHGGVVRLIDVKDNTAYLEFGGGCQGCGMVSVTLKYGVEKLIRERVPEIGQILDTTDHASGENPYYAPAAK